ncbi:M36 family metallopeptidase [Haliangium sp.]|uniref:M36 family metallopeptidase n=1 Tax=Haliangium sp. TaxID=2663208 RepID=UPI003D0A1F15
MLAISALAAGTASAGPDQDRNYDARADYNAGFVKSASSVQLTEIETLRRSVPELSVTFDEGTGATRSLYNAVGYLSSRTSADPMAIARQYIATNYELLGLTKADLVDYEVTDVVYTKATGATHIYLRQTYQGVPVYNGQLHVNINRDGRIISVNNAFVPDLARAVGSASPGIDALTAVSGAAYHLGARMATPPQAVYQPAGDVRGTTVILANDLSMMPVEAKLMWLPVRAGDVRLVWNFEIQTLDTNHWYDMNVDAQVGDVWTRFDWTAGDGYRVYGQPVESPNHTSPTPPSDARTLVSNPAHPVASPNGWVDSGSTIMDGNNVHACADANANNSCDSGEPSGGAGLNFDFAIDLSSAPSASTAAAIANLFYWNNTIHDVQYQYGFDEAGGNFQENNFGRGGSGSDSVNADAQDGSGNCNANMSTPPDGGNPRMQMFTCNRATPSRDGDFDNGVIVHEYGHGISIRQVGGPSTSSCLNNSQQAGEGWSDFFGLVYTAKPGDTGPQARGIGSYLFNEAPNGGTIRDLPYSTDTAVNNWTYESISGAAIPHGVGSRWAQAVWEVYWALVDRHGFDPDLTNAFGGAGNTRALLYVNEGLKNTACSPTFVDNRNGIIQAATDNFGGEDVCLIWETFAAFGLGTDAVSGGSNSTNPSNGFSVPAACDNTPPPPPPPPVECPEGSIDFNSFGLSSYADQDVSGTTSVSADGSTLTLTNNTWKRSTATFNVTASTVLEFDFASTQQGEIHAIGFDDNNTLNDAARHFMFFGSQNWTGAGKIDLSPTYSGGGAFQSYSIPVGDFYTGTMNLVFTNDNDAGSGNNGQFRCVRVVDDATPPPPPGNCTVDDDFESGAAGWTTGGTCTTGDFVLGTPTEVSNGGVITQVGGDNTSGSGNALFTAVNSSAGVDDVDGGECVLDSPSFLVANASTLRVSYFHGQRDAGDDPNGDFFVLEVSTDGGATFSAVVDEGDITSNAAWSEVTTQIPAGSDVRVRVRASDGTSAGDLVEGGIDDLSICDN